MADNPATAYIDKAIVKETYEESLRLSAQDREKALVQARDGFYAADDELSAPGVKDDEGELRRKAITLHSVWKGHVDAFAQKDARSDMEAYHADPDPDLTARIMSGDGAPPAPRPNAAQLQRYPAVLDLYRGILGDESLTMEGWVRKYQANLVDHPGFKDEATGLVMEDKLQNARRLAKFLSPFNVYDPLANTRMLAVESGNADGTISAGPFALDPNVPSSRVLDVIQTTPATNYTIKYRKKGAFPSGRVTNVLETGDAPDWTPTTSSAEDKLRRIALRYSITRPTLLDDQSLAQEFDTDLVDAVRGQLSKQILYGDGSAPEIMGLAQLGSTAVEYRPWTNAGNTALDYEHFGEALDQAFGLFGGGTGGIVGVVPNPNVLVLNRVDWYEFTSALMTKSGALQVPLSSLTSMITPSWRGARLVLDEQVNQFSKTTPSAKNYFGFLFNNDRRITQLYVNGNFGVSIVQMDDDVLKDSMTHIIHFYASLVTRAPKGVILLNQPTGSAGRVHPAP